MRSPGSLLFQKLFSKVDHLYLVALNYGRKVTAYDAQVLNFLALQSSFLQSFSEQLKETEDAFKYTIHTLREG